MTSSNSPRDVIRLAMERTGSQSIRALSERIGVSEAVIRRFEGGEKASTYHDSLAIFRAAGLVPPPDPEADG